MRVRSNFPYKFENLRNLRKICAERDQNELKSRFADKPSPTHRVAGILPICEAADGNREVSSTALRDHRS